MKKRILILLIATSLCFMSIHAQKTNLHQCDSIKAQLDQALILSDSLAGNQNELQKQLDESRLQISKLKSEVSSLLKEKNETTAVLTDAGKLISEQTDKIKELEAEVKRLSGGKSPGKKGK